MAVTTRLIVSFWLTLCALPCQAETRTCTVTAVHDGDTMTATCAGATTRVRISSIDAPELAQDYGREAQQATEQLTLGRTVTLTIHDYDRYGRTVAAVTLPDERDLARELVRSGDAWHYQRYSRDAKLAELEAEARSARAGLWADVSATAPSVYRQGNRERVMSRRGERRSAVRRH